MSVTGYLTARTTRSLSATTTTRRSRTWPAARNVGSRSAAVSARSASDSSGKGIFSASAKRACSSERCVETPCTATPAARKSSYAARNSRFSSVQPAAPGMSDQPSGSGVGTPVAG